MSTGPREEPLSPKDVEDVEHPRGGVILGSKNTAVVAAPGSGPSLRNLSRGGQGEEQTPQPSPHPPGRAEEEGERAGEG